MAIMESLLLEEVDSCVTLAPLLTVSLSLCKYDPSKPPLTVFLDFLTEILALAEAVTRFLAFGSCFRSDGKMQNQIFQNFRVLMYSQWRPVLNVTPDSR